MTYGYLRKLERKINNFERFFMEQITASELY